MSENNTPPLANQPVNIPDPAPQHVFEFILQETDLDTFGHMNHANYLVIFEQARWDWLDKGGFGLTKIQEMQVGPTILGLEIQYRREIKHREKIKIHSWCPVYKGKIAKVIQKMLNEKGEECARISLTIALFDMKRRKLIAPIPEWLKAIGLHTAD